MRCIEAIIRRRRLIHTELIPCDHRCGEDVAGGVLSHRVFRSLRFCRWIRSLHRVRDGDGCVE